MVLSCSLIEAWLSALTTSVMDGTPHLEYPCGSYSQRGGTAWTVVHSFEVMGLFLSKLLSILTFKRIFCHLVLGILTIKASSNHP